jgi:hypothetical protein
MLARRLDPRGVDRVAGHHLDGGDQLRLGDLGRVRYSRQAGKRERSCPLQRVR